MSKRKLELQDGLAALDAALTEHRYLMDGHARGRRYKDLSEVAVKCAAFAKQAQDKQTELDAILEAEWKAMRG
jgi:hypothetical protein